MALLKTMLTSRNWESSSGLSKDEIPHPKSDEEDFVKINDNECKECLEEYIETSDKCDYIKCTVCNKLHVTYSSKFLNIFAIWAIIVYFNK